LHTLQVLDEKSLRVALSEELIQFRSPGPSKTQGFIDSICMLDPHGYYPERLIRALFGVLEDQPNDRIHL
jgi:hypothetical protein